MKRTLLPEGCLAASPEKTGQGLIISRPDLARLRPLSGLKAVACSVDSTQHPARADRYAAPQGEAETYVHNLKFWEQEPGANLFEAAASDWEFSDPNHKKTAGMWQMCAREREKCV